MAIGDPSPQDLGDHIGRAAVDAVAFLSRRDRAVVARQLGRITALDAERQALVTDLLDRLRMNVKDNPPTAETARLVRALTDGLRVVSTAEVLS
jgi:hypothetical protein